MMATILNSALFDSVMLHKTLTQTSSIWLKLNHSDSTWWSSHLEFCHHGFSHFAQKNFTHSFWLNLMIAAMLKSAILNAAMYKKNFIHSFSLNLMKAPILNSAIMDSAILHKKKLHSFILTQLDEGSPSCWIQRLPSWIQTTCYLLSDSLKNTLPPLWIWLKLIQSDSNSFNLSWWWQQLCHLQPILQTTHTWIQRLPSQKKLPSFRLTCYDSWTLPSCIQPFEQKNFTLHSHSNWWLQLCWNLQSLTQTHSFWLNLMMAAILNSAMEPACTKK